MTLQELVDSLTDRLAELGFTITEQRSGGPMGSALWRFSSDMLDLQILNDRGQHVVIWGPKGGPLYNFIPWGELLGFSLEKTASFEMQLDFVLEHLPQITDKVAEDPAIVGKLRQINSEIVRRRLGLDEQRRKVPRQP